ncbi:unnamed protein product, partial [Mesorhabditis spiculigera]
MSNPFHDYNSQPIKSYASHAIEDDAEYYEKEIEKCMQESLASTERSRRNLVDSEQVGLKTAEDLRLQREKLEKTERNLDDIHRTTQQTQRSLNSLQSFFGGYFKNKFSRKPKPVEAQPEAPPKSASVNNFASFGGSGGNSMGSSSTGTGGPTLSQSSMNAIKGSRWEAMDNQINENLDGMSSQLANLKNLGVALGREVEDQNQLLDRIQTKAERNDVVVRSQDQQMKKLLGGK